ncbi:MAG TPA: HAMP domain-containing sensor histidine kinase, partial [Candidatus Acidoferrales bacterium]|nr:HAMP domain-containing sensor histidine kinase [Candidatus Acidoferrales bacterium]
MADSRFRAALLQQEDLVRFNQWLWITRLQSVAAILGVILLLKWVDPMAVRFAPIGVIVAADLALSIAYNRWLMTRRRLRLLAYTQLIADALALVAGLNFIYDSGLLFHFVLLLVVVPASMMEWQCGALIAALSTVGHFVLMATHEDGAWLSVAGLAPPTAFFVVTLQALFYVRHLEQKNAELAASTESLNQSNLRLEEEATIAAGLLRVAHALTTSLDPQEILGRLSDAVRELLRCEWSATLLYEPQRDAYRLAAASGSNIEALEEVRTFEFTLDMAPLFRLTREQGVVAIEDRRSTLFPAALMERWNVASFLCANLQCAGAPVGLLAAGFNERAGPFSAREIRLFRSLAQQAAMALENARLVESLRAASRLKSEFIGTMSHELRSPLNVVIGYVDLLLEGDMGTVPPEQYQALERVRQHALQLLDLIQETLDVNRLEAGLLPLDIETFSVREFTDELKDSIPATWVKPGVVLSWQIDPASLTLRSDRVKLKKVLRNLIHNALKFTDRGTVTVSTAAFDTWLDFVVTDTGIGISPEA